jgi:hypothetical protein
VPWGDAPYTPHLLPADQEPDLVLFTSAEQRLLLQVVLVDAATAEVKAMRGVSLSPEFSRALAAAVQAQALRPWRGRDDYDRQLAEVYQRFPSSEALLAVAAAHGEGGC